MRLAVALALALAMAAWPSRVAAEPCKAAVAVQVPCEGVLWPAPATAAALVTRQRLRTCQAMAKRDAAVAQVELDEVRATARRDAETAAAALAAAETRAASWRQLADERGHPLDLPALPPLVPPPAPRWYARPWVAPVAFVAGVAVTGAVWRWR